MVIDEEESKVRLDRLPLVRLTTYHGVAVLEMDLLGEHFDDFALFALFEIVRSTASHLSQMLDGICVAG